MPRHQERDALRAGTGTARTALRLPAVEQAVERRLQQVQQPVLEQHRVGGRLRADARLRRLGSVVRQSRAACTSCRPAGGSVAARRRRRTPTGGAGNFQPSVVTLSSSRPSDRTHGARSAAAPRGRRVRAALEPRVSGDGVGDSRDVDSRHARRRPASVACSVASGGTVGHPHLAGLGDRLADAGERLGQIDRRVHAVRALADHGRGRSRTAPAAAAPPDGARVGERRSRPPAAACPAGARPPASRPATAAAGRPACRSRSGRACAAVFSTSVLPIRSASRYSVRVGP